MVLIRMTEDANFQGVSEVSESLSFQEVTWIIFDIISVSEWWYFEKEC